MQRVCEKTGQPIVHRSLGKTSEETFTILF